MHYIRLLRCLATGNAKNAYLYECRLVFTITTDLGDDFYAPLQPLRLSFFVENTEVGNVDGKPVFWQAGMRAMSLKLRIPIPELFHGPATLHIYAASQRMPRHARGTVNPTLPFWSHGLKEPQLELIIPCHAKLEEDTLLENSYRAFPLPGGDDLLFEEELGESIARHVWDAGVIAASYISDMCQDKEAMNDILPIASDKECVKILELGCGIGVLGITVASVLEQVAKTQGYEATLMKVLLTDVAEAEERASSNIVAARNRYREDERPLTALQLGYETLDWDDGKEGNFGRLASQRWDQIILSDCTYNVDSFPALVGTLSAVHANNCELARSECTTHVLLATKPRHSSEESLFGVLEEEGWRHRVAKSIPIIRDNAEDEIVYIYMLEKGPNPAPAPASTSIPAQSSPFSPAKKRRTSGPFSPTKKRKILGPS